MKLFDLMYTGRSLGFTASAIGSTTLAAIFYQTALGDFVYKTDANGNAILDNQGPVGSLNDGQLYSGRGIELGATNDVDIPIHHTLGAEQLNNTWAINSIGDGTVVWSSANSQSLNVATTVVGTSSNSPSFYQNLSNSSELGQRYKLVFDALVNSGTATLVVARVGEYIPINHTIVDGLNEIEIDVGSTTSANLVLYFNGTILFDIELTNITLKQITNPNSYLTYYDFTDGLVTLGNSVDGGSSEELTKDKEFNDGTIVYPSTYATYEVSDGILTGTGVGSVPTNQTITVVATAELSDKLVVGRKYLFSDKVLSATHGTVGYNTGGFVFETGNAYYYHASGDIIGEHKVIATCTDVNASIRLHISTTPEAITQWEYFSLTEILPISTKYTLKSKTVNNVLKHTTNWNASDRVKVENNPNLIGKLALETTGATKTIPELDMVMDATTGEEKLTTVASAVISGDEISSYIRNSSTSFDLAVTTAGTNILRPLLDLTGSIQGGNKYEVYFKAVVTSGTPIIRAVYNGVTQKILDYTIVNGENRIEFDCEKDFHATVIYFNGTNLFDISVTDVSIKKKNIDSYYMCSEKSGAYLVDSRVAYGAEILSGTYNITGNDNLGVVENPNGVFTSDGTNTVTSYIVDSTAPMTMYGEKVATFITISNYSAGNVQVYYNNITNVSGVLTANGSYGFVGEVKTGGNDSYIVTVSADFVGVISLLSAKQASAQDIANYASTVRTNADLQQKGLQATAFVTDEAGVPTSYSSNLLQFNGDGRYIDTGISMTDTLTGTFECVAMLRKTGEHKSIFGVEGRELSVWDNNYLYFKYGAEWGLTNTFTDNSVSHIIGIVENGLITGFYVNGVSTSIVTVTDSGITSNCIIGAKRLVASNTYSYKDEIGYFKYYIKALTATEVATTYAQAKAIYPTLP